MEGDKKIKIIAFAEFININRQEASFSFGEREDSKGGKRMVKGRKKNFFFQ